MRYESNKAVIIYGASSTTLDPRYYEAAREVGRLVASHKAMIVNGGGHGGLMGATIDGCLEEGGRCYGVIPAFMHARGWAHPGLTNVEITPDMHTRKSTMASLGTSALALPGGVGTLEEFSEIITWRKLGLWHGPVVLLNTLGFWTPLVEMLKRMIEQDFINPSDEQLWYVADTPEDAVNHCLML